jgi:hypothetical protein
MLEFEATGAPAVNVTVPPILEMGDVIDNVLTSAVFEARVQLDTPRVLVAEQVP